MSVSRVTWLDLHSRNPRPPISPARGRPAGRTARISIGYSPSSSPSLLRAFHPRHPISQSPVGTSTHCSEYYPILVSREAIVAAPESKGRVALYEAATGRLLTAKVLPELSHAFQQDILVNPASAGICVLGLGAGPYNTLTYRAGCYSNELARQWNKPFTFPGERAVTVRQLGPEHLCSTSRISSRSFVPAGRRARARRSLLRRPVSVIR